MLGFCRFVLFLRKEKCLEEEMREFGSHLLFCLFIAGVVFREISKGCLAFSVLLFTISGVDRLYVYKRPSWGRSKIPMTAFTAPVPRRGAVSPPIWYL